VRTAAGRDRAEGEAYAQRANAHLGRGDYGAALSDSRRAEQPLVAVTENYGRLQVEDQIVGTVVPGQKVTIVDVSGDFVAVSATLQDGRTVSGWLHKSSCPLKPVPTPGSAVSPQLPRNEP